MLPDHSIPCITPAQAARLKRLINKRVQAEIRALHDPTEFMHQKYVDALNKARNDLSRFIRVITR